MWSRRFQTEAVPPAGSATIASRPRAGRATTRDGNRIRSDGRSIDVLALIGDHGELIESREATANQVDPPP